MTKVSFISKIEYLLNDNDNEEKPVVFSKIFFEYDDRNDSVSIDEYSKTGKFFASLLFTEFIERYMEIIKADEELYTAAMSFILGQN